MKYVDIHRVSDRTSLSTREGRRFLAVILDPTSRAIVGWSMTTTLRAEIVVNASEAALQRRKPCERILCHSDRGSRYVSEGFLGVARRRRVRLSMSRRANCWDDAVAERFFGTIKTEPGDRYGPLAPKRAAIFDDIGVW